MVLRPGWPSRCGGHGQAAAGLRSGAPGDARMAGIALRALAAVVGLAWRLRGRWPCTWFKDWRWPCGFLAVVRHGPGAVGSLGAGCPGGAAQRLCRAALGPRSDRDSAGSPWRTSTARRWWCWRCRGWRWSPEAGNPGLQTRAGAGPRPAVVTPTPRTGRESPAGMGVCAGRHDPGIDQRLGASRIVPAPGRPRLPRSPAHRRHHVGVALTAPVAAPGARRPAC